MSLLILAIILICACGIVFWFLSVVPIPAPFNYVLYAILAILALHLLFNLAHRLPGTPALGF